MTDKKTQKIAFVVGILLIVGVSLTIALTQERILRGGTEVILKTRPVDPRDFFRGEYVILRYEIEQLPMVVSYAEILSRGSDLYMYLEEGFDGSWYPREVTEVRPTDLSGPWIRGEVTGFGEVRFPDIEQYYVPEGAGRPIEALREELHVRVMLDEGEARAVELLDGNLTPIDPFEYRERIIEEEREPQIREPVPAPVE